MANVFTRTNESTPAPKRNTFDGSFVNNLTLKMGQITPCFLKEVIPGDSFKIDATFGFNFQPMVFPVQTGMQANLHFFYVRNRALWRGWQNFITKTDNKDNDTIPPYIKLTAENRTMFETGKIGDYLGVPTVFYSSDAASTDVRWSPYDSTAGKYRYGKWYDYTLENLSSLITPFFATGLGNITDNDTFVSNMRRILEGYNVFDGGYLDNNRLYAVDNRLIMPLWYSKVPIGSNQLDTAVPFIGYNAQYPDNDSSPSSLTVLFHKDAFGVVVVDTLLFRSYRSEAGDILFNNWSQFNNTRLWNNPSSGHINISGLDPTEQYYIASIQLGKLADQYALSQSGSQYTVKSAAGVPIENSSRDLEDLPFCSTDNEGGIRISALPFRAVEACYNSFYRDSRNNPLRVDGKELYNTWILDNTGGADVKEYTLYQRNWQDDVFTTAVQSPQQGVAPLVGVTSTGTMTFQDEEGKTYTMQAEIGADGHTITGIKSYSDDMPRGTLRAMVDTVSSGISINDFRNVNALQRWLETNMRKGLRYKDQLEAHFGVSPTYSELDMPEFIGGMSRDVSMSKIVQTSQSSEGHPLGTLAGSASVLGDAGQSVTKFCEEHGWIIGFITISPVPVYSQQLNKQLLKTELLDYYFPEFAHAPYQPILNQEIAPLQCRDEVGKKLHDVFGYQRAWYEYLSSQDEVHGDFRTTMRDYLINRVFADVPQLGSDFLTISTHEANDVFAVDDDSDKIFGQIYFNVSMKRSIPFASVPMLEVGR